MTIFIDILLIVITLFLIMVFVHAVVDVKLEKLDKKLDEYLKDQKDLLEIVNKE